MQVVTSFESLTCEIVFVVDGITIGSLPKQPQFDQNFPGTGLGFASKRIFLRKTNERIALIDIHVHIRKCKLYFRLSYHGLLSIACHSEQNYGVPAKCLPKKSHFFGGDKQQCGTITCVKIFDIYYGIKNPVSLKLEYCFAYDISNFMGSMSKASRFW